MKALHSILPVLVGLLVIPAAAADIASGINRIRSRGCEGRRGISTPLKPSRGLDEVARIWSRGGRLHEAVARTDYRAVNSASMRVEGTDDEERILDVLSESYCHSILEPSFTEIGVYQKGKQVWVVVAAPFAVPSAADARKVADRVLVLVNRARASPRQCGSTGLPAVPPLQPSVQLDAAALAHARDMTSHSMFEHRGSDGSTPADRVSRTGYVWKSVGENIAAGSADAESVVKGWLDSPGHCRNIMGPQFTEMGLAYASDPKSEAGIYWSQVFGTPLPKPRKR